ncbi:MAG TPA: hypothetical protein VF717_14180, partial [Pyrinomonadaceae bacterium]
YILQYTFVPILFNELDAVFTGAKLADCVIPVRLNNVFAEQIPASAIFLHRMYVQLINLPS